VQYSIHYVSGKRSRDRLYREEDAEGLFENSQQTTDLVMIYTVLKDKVIGD